MKKIIKILLISGLLMYILSPAFCAGLYSQKKVNTLLPAMQTKFKKVSQTLSSRSNLKEMRKKDNASSFNRRKAKTSALLETTSSKKTGKDKDRNLVPQARGQLKGGSKPSLLRADSGKINKAGNIRLSDKDKNEINILPESINSASSKEGRIEKDKQTISQIEPLGRAYYAGKEKLYDLYINNKEDINDHTEFFSELYMKAGFDDYVDIISEGIITDKPEEDEQTTGPSDAEIVEGLREVCGNDFIEALSKEKLREMIDYTRGRGYEYVYNAMDSFNRVFGESSVWLFVDNSDYDLKCLKDFLRLSEYSGHEELADRIEQISQLFDTTPRELIKFSKARLESLISAISGAAIPEDPDDPLNSEVRFSKSRCEKVMNGLKILGLIYSADSFSGLYYEEDELSELCNSLAEIEDIEPWYDSLCASFGKTGVDNIFKSIKLKSLLRFHADDWNEIVVNRLENKDDGRPLAVIVYPDSDWNGAYYTHKHIVNSLIKKGYRVMYYCAGTDTEFIESMEDATHEVKASVLFLGGHANQSLMRLGDGDRENVFVDTTYDLNQFQEAGLGSMLEPGGVVILNGCSTGKGEEDADNLVNFFCNVFSNAGMIIGQNNVGCMYHIEYDDNGNITGVKYSSEAYVAVPRPNKKHIILSVEDGRVNFEEIRQKISEIQNDYR